MSLKIIDSHIHFWDPALFRYSWMKDAPKLRHCVTLSTSAFKSWGKVYRLLIEHNSGESDDPTEASSEYGGFLPEPHP